MLNSNFFSWLKPIGLRVGLHILDTLLPPNCLVCDTPVDATGQFCLPCFRNTNFISAPLCAQCGVPLPFSAAVGAGGLCPVCTLVPPAFTQARAALRYDETTKRLILPFKYADRTEAAGGLAVLMARRQCPVGTSGCSGPGAAAQVAVARPAVNQSALLAAALGRIAKRSVMHDALVRHRATAPLGPLGITERQAELDGAIIVRPGGVGRLMAKTVLLIDDVMTSGTTANVCARALLNARAFRVDVLTAARVPDPRLE
jgi:predicted amidophosphoribosyltransferase